jgi:hypothetical protein
LQDRKRDGENERHEANRSDAVVGEVRRSREKRGRHSGGTDGTRPFPRRAREGYIEKYTAKKRTHICRRSLVRERKTETADHRKGTTSHVERGKETKNHRKRSTNGDASACVDRVEYEVQKRERERGFSIQEN